VVVPTPASKVMATTRGPGDGAVTVLRPAIVAGRGAVSGFGIGRPVLVAGIFAGRSAVLPRRRTAGGDVPTAVAAELPAAALHALGGDDDLALRAGVSAPGSIDLVLASTKGDLGGIARPGDGLGRPARLARRLAAQLGLRGVAASVSCACASGLVALSLAARRLALGEHERLLVVGVDVLEEFILAGFGSLHALDPDACRPFDAARRGVTLGEGAAAMLLTIHAGESLGAALVGHGGANDACHVTGPDRQGAGLALAATRAVRSAGLDAAAIDLVHLHGTATVANDATEALGLVTTFGGRTPPAFGTKGQTGHTLGASGVLEAIVAIEALHRATIPANHGLRTTDVDARLDLVQSPRSLPRARHALKVASGFGGVQAAIVIQT
jgi:3-oxoacyl-[acyl-carrier-protein] synthase-1